MTGGAPTKGGVQRLNLDQITLDGTVVLATGAEINRVADASTRIVNVTASTLAVTEVAHDSKIITLNRAAGIAVTVPAATGSGAVYEFQVRTTVTSNTITITLGSQMFGYGVLSDVLGVDPVAVVVPASGTTITMNGGSTGGFAGDTIKIVDVAANLYSVYMLANATAIPFS